MLRVSTPTKNERLVADLTDAAITLQALAQRVRTDDGLPSPLRAHALPLAQAGQAAALAAVAANCGHSTRELTLFYGQWLNTTGKKKDQRSALDEEGYMPLGER